MQPRSESSLEQLRDALRQRGYLDRGFDRLILRSAGSRLAWLWGSLKSGIVAGLFLGLSFLTAILFLNGPPLTSSREIALLGLYLVLLCAGAAIFVELVAGILARILSRVLPGMSPDPGWVAWGVGGLAALGFTLYLSAWWRGRDESGWAWGAHLSILTLILLVSLAIGRLTSTTALLSLIRPGALPKRPLRDLPRGLALLAFLLVVAVALAIPWERKRSIAPGERAAPFSVASREGRILWIGIDGLGSELMEALQAKAHLRNLSELERLGCRVTLARTESEPPAVWVSAATGFPQSRHGIHGAESIVFPGIETPLEASSRTALLVQAARVINPWLPQIREIPVSGMHRKDKMVWEILGEKGIPSFVANWWATWPAVEGPGIRISERAFFRLQEGGTSDMEVFPAALMDSLRSTFSTAFQRGATRALPSQEGGGPELGLVMDAFHLGEASKAWRKESWPLVAVYLNGTEVLAAAPQDSSDRTRMLIRDDALVAHLDRLDEEIGRLAGTARPTDFILVEGDPGRSNPDGKDRGFLLAKGPNVVPGESFAGTLMDLAPTLLRLSGFPLSREMPGRPLLACFTQQSPIRLDRPPWVQTYGQRKPPAAGESRFDPEVLEKLRSLGYIR